RLRGAGDPAVAGESGRGALGALPHRRQLLDCARAGPGAPGPVGAAGGAAQLSFRTAAQAVEDPEGGVARRSGRGASFREGRVGPDDPAIAGYVVATAAG